MHLGKVFTLLLLFFISFTAVAQDTTRPVKVAVLVPLYLDSAFSGASYKLGNNNLPKYLLPGLEFYNGVMMAIDSLQAEGRPLEVLIHDTKSREKSLNLLLVEPEIASASFIIGSFTTKDELKKVADFSAAKNIPLLSATYPNDGGITNNPNVALINPTLATHIEGIFKYVQRNHSFDNVLLLKRKSDAMDNYIMETVMESAKKYSGMPMRINYIEVNDAFAPQELISHLDSNKKNVVIGATLSDGFAAALVRALSSVKNSYESIAVGMPNWDNMRELNRADTRGVEIIFSTPYNYQRSDKLLARLAGTYRSRLNGKASDMVFKGFEAFYHFTRLYQKHGNAFLKNLSDREFRIASEYDFQPTRARKDDYATDYLENKKLYFVKKQDGVIKSTN